MPKEIKYAPAYMLPDFAQSLPGDPDDYELLTADTKKAGQVRYRDRATGQTFTVPNIPCNQQTRVKLEHARYMLNAAIGRLDPPDRWARESHKEYIAQLRRKIAILTARLKGR